jgi:hypothetical protein
MDSVLFCYFFRYEIIYSLDASIGSALCITGYACADSALILTIFRLIKPNYPNNPNNPNPNKVTPNNPN